MYIGDFPEDFATVTVMFTTHDANGAPVAPNSAFEAADIIIYKNGNAAQKTTTNGVTMTSPFDSITGLHCVVIDTSNDTGDGGFWVTGAQYTVILSPDETVNSQAVAKVVGVFGIECAPVLRPTVAGRELDVTTTGGAGIDWGNVENATTAVNLSATNIDTDQVVASVSGAVGSVTGAVGSVTGNVGGNVTGSVGSVATGGITAASFAANAITAAKLDPDVTTELQAGLATSSAVSTLQTSVDDLPTNAELSTALAGADDAVLAAIAGLNNLSQANVRSAVGLASANLDTQLDALPTNAELATALASADDAVLAAIAALNNLSAAQVNAEVDTALADVGVTTTVTGRIDAAISTRLASSSYTAPDNSSITAIKAKTDSLAFTVPGQVDANIQSVNDVTVNGNGAGTPWGP